MIVSFAENVVVTPSYRDTQGSIKLGEIKAPIDELNIGPAFVNYLARRLEDGISIEDLLVGCLEEFAGSENMSGAMNAQITKWSEYGFIVFDSE